MIGLSDYPYDLEPNYMNSPPKQMAKFHGLTSFGPKKPFSHGFSDPDRPIVPLEGTSHW